MEEKRLRLGEILVEAGVLGEQQLAIALSIQKKRGLRLGQILLQEGFISEPQLVQALSRRLSIPWVSLEHVDIADELLELVPVNVAEEFFLIPVYVQSLDRYNRTLFVAMNDPTDEAALRFVSATAGMPVKPMVAGPSDISTAIQMYYYGDEEVAEYSAPMIHSSSAPPLAISLVPDPVKEAPSPTQCQLVETDDEGGAHPLSEEPVSIVELSDSAAPPPSGPPGAADAPAAQKEAAADAEARHSKVQREVEKHMFGVGSRHRGISLTLLDGTKIDFGGAATRRKSISPADEARAALLKSLRAAAHDVAARKGLPAETWEPFMAALLEVLFKKNLLFYDEFIKALERKE